MRTLAAGVTGLLFGVGLLVSGMTNPGKVLAFLDVTGKWDPTLAFVMGGALGVNALAWALTRRRARPLFAEEFALSPESRIEPSLLGGAALFGVGWGLVGLCPGPALAGLLRGDSSVYVFAAALLVGIGMVRNLRAFPRPRGTAPLHPR
jgi:uncharacterized protein